MALKRWCPHLRTDKGTDPGDAYTWFDSQHRIWRPLLEQWYCCPICRAPRPDTWERKPKEWKALRGLLWVIGVALVLYIAFRLLVLEEVLEQVRNVPILGEWL